MSCGSGRGLLARQKHKGGRHQEAGFLPGCNSIWVPMLNQDVRLQHTIMHLQASYRGRGVGCFFPAVTSFLNWDGGRATGSFTAVDGSLLEQFKLFSSLLSRNIEGGLGR